MLTFAVGKQCNILPKMDFFPRFSSLCMILSGSPLEWPLVGTPSSKLENNFLGITTNNQMKKRQLDQACKTTPGSFVSNQTICSSCCILVMMATQLWRIFAKRFPPRSSSTFSFAIYNQIHRIVLILDVNSLWMFFIQDIFFAYFLKVCCHYWTFFKQILRSWP